MFTFLIVLQAIIAAALVTVILMQRSEGGGLTSSGSPSGLMSARGAADFLTRATSVLAGLFILMSITLAFLAASRGAVSVDTSLQRRAPAAQTQAQPPVAAQPVPATADNAVAPAPADNGVPLAR
ncbi:preprotein translocase subunit SecG [Sphingomonas sp. 8AM]|jgi:preprotein translocase subunit SecG|uniref:preprotein translocase subunit SecG n=1 Tax=Sphingomonas sp. 8AM TaxID=2653170 RepID=UPI0012F14E51|nr:preprotein translocase subunit SecG [Sphingomonas sp. 8AM]VXD03484.1 Protein-export membrane protein SecG [Sphingomonas sp. 8AM]